MAVFPAFATEAPAATDDEPTLVTIIVVNHNYGRFVGEAVDSALAQREVAVQVIVVDDGSTDGSREVLARYADRVELINQENRGQAAAFNAGLAAALGSVVFYLDADDVLVSGVAVAAATLFGRDPALSRVVFRLTVVDERGHPTGELMPARDVPLPRGDVRHDVLAFGDDLAWPPTSGNAFATWALRRVMPLPETGSLVDADSWLHPTIPLLGAVEAMTAPGGAYRAHGDNHAFRGSLDVGRSRRIIVRTLEARARLRDLATELDYPWAGVRSVSLAAHRMVSVRLGDAGHPIAGDTRWRVLADGIRSALARRDVGWLRRLAYLLWFLAAAVCPRAATGALAESFFMPTRRRRGLRSLLAR